MWAQTAGSVPLPQLVTFVAPAYPRLANDGRMMGTTVTRIKVGKDGVVIEADIVSSGLRHVRARRIETVEIRPIRTGICI
jgi:hypothetical protein